MEIETTIKLGINKWKMIPTLTQSLHDSQLNLVLITILNFRVIEKFAYSALHNGLDVPQNFLCLLDFHHPVLWNGLKTKPDRQTDRQTDEHYSN